MRHSPSPYVAATLAGLLSWDLENLAPDERPLVVAFADAVEYIHGADRGQERLLNRIIHLTPGVLWVATSRDSLDWAGPNLTRALPASGPLVWPGLQLEAREDPRQHLVGALSDDDVLRYLETASDAAGNPHLPRAAIERIREGAHGLPLYLDLALAVARAAGSRPLDPATFGGPLPELAITVLADLPDSERELARIASLVPRFDPALLAEVAEGLVGDAHRFCRRTLVTRDDHSLFPYRLHDAVRSALAEESAESGARTSPGAWAAEDRIARAAALVEVLRVRHDAVLGNVEHRLAVLELAAQPCADHGLRAPWLLERLSELPGLSRVIRYLPPASGATWMGQVAGIYEAWRGRDLRQRIPYWENYLAGSLPPDIRRAGLIRLAYAYRSSGQPERCLEIFVDLLADTPDSDLCRHQVARTLRWMGDYEAMERHLAQYPLQDPSADLRLRSDLDFDRGDVVRGMAGPAARAAYLRARGHHRLALDNGSSALWRGALIGRTQPAECDAFLADVDRYGMIVEMRTALACRALCLGGGNDAAVRRALAESASLITASSGVTGWREWSVRLIHGLRTGDRRLVTDVRDEWVATGHAWSPNYQTVEHILVFAGYPATYPPVRLGDADDPAVVSRRWHTVIEDLVNAP